MGAMCSGTGVAKARRADKAGAAASAAQQKKKDVAMIRRMVPNDHSCLFWAIAYAAEGGEASSAKARELREICAQDALSDPDPVTRALLLGFENVEEYATWIRNEFHWGGENEVLALSRHYVVEVALVSCESLQVLCYGSDTPSCKGRVYILYTGQHYDPLVAGASIDTPTDEEQRCFSVGDVSLDSQAVELARAHNDEAARKATQRKVKKIKCGGCGAELDDAEAFATHCQEVEHGDDFAYDCEEVEVVIEGDEPLPEGSINLDSDSVHTFINRAEEVLSNLYPAPVTINGVAYRSLEHYWLAAPFLGRDEDLVSRIASAATPDTAVILAEGADVNAPRPDWREARQDCLMEGIRAKAAQCPAFVEALKRTVDKTIVCVDTDAWAGMQAPGGIATGQNHVGKALMTVRGEMQ